MCIIEFSKYNSTLKMSVFALLSRKQYIEAIYVINVLVARKHVGNNAFQAGIFAALSNKTVIPTLESNFMVSHTYI